MGFFSKLFGGKEKVEDVPSDPPVVEVPAPVPATPAAPRKPTAPQELELRPSSQPGVVQVKDLSELAAGDIVRIWHTGLGEWIPGWWCEVGRIDEKDVVLTDVRTGEDKTRSVKNMRDYDIPPGGVWKHLFPDFVRGTGGASGAQQAKKLAALKEEYEGVDLGGLADGALIARLGEEVSWLRSKSEARYHIADEYAIHEKFVARIGAQLNRRGGTALMRQAFASAEGNRHIEGLWSGIGEWRG